MNVLNLWVKSLKPLKMPKMPLAASFLVLAMLALLGATARGASDTWTGATSANWSQSNWTGGYNPPVTGDSLIFTSVTGGYMALNNNLTTASFNLANITYSAGAAAFTVSGNAFALTGNITNSSANLETINDPFSLAGPQIFATTAGGGNLALGGNLSGAGGITLAGSGWVTLSGANSYAGGTTNNGGTLLLNSASALPATTVLTVNSGGAVDLAGHSVAIAGFGTGSSGGLITNSASSSGTLTVSDWNAGLNTLVADGANGPVALAFKSSGNVAGGSLNNNNNTFSGGLTIGNAASGSGYARFQLTATPVNTGVPGNITNSLFGRGTITIGNAAADRAQLWALANGTILNNIICNSALGADIGGALRIDANVAFAGTLTANLATISLSEHGGGTAALTGQITGPNGLWLENDGFTTSLTVTLDNVSANVNNYQGPTTVDSLEILVLGAPNQIPNGVSAGNVTLNGTFKLNGNSETVNGLLGVGVVDGVSGAPTLTVGDDNATSEFDGVIKNSGGSLSLIKIGAGTLTLSGANSYSGATMINAGVLQEVVGGSSSSSAVTVGATAGNSATLGVNVTDVSKQWTCSSLTVNNAGTSSGLQFSFGTLTPSTAIAPLNITGGVTFSTPPAFTISGNNLPATTGNGYPLMTWGSGPAPSLSGATLTLVPAITSGNLFIANNTLYLQCGSTSGNSLSLTVTNGSGSGNYTNGSQVAITAMTDPAGMVFSYWAINSGTPVFANSNAPSTTLTMPMNSTASVTAIFTNIPMPPAITNLGGWSLAWNDEFDDGLASIDLNNTQTNGFKWYVQSPGYAPAPASYYTNPEPSVVRILGALNTGSQLSSSVAMNLGYNLVDSAGFYLEGRIRLLSTSYVFANSWPAFWLRGSDGAYSGSAAPWPGITNGWQNSVEIDLMEYTGGTSYGSALHDWYGSGPFTDNNAHTLWSGNSYGGYPTNVWHTYGCLVVPSWQTSNGMGYAKMYFDNVFVSGFSVTWRNPTNLYSSNPNTTETPSGSDIYSTSELWHHIITIGTALTNSPLDVDWVRVWQPAGITTPRVQTNGFGFGIGDYHTTNVVEACTNLANPVWQPIRTNSINGYETNGNPFLNNPLNANPIYFSDSYWTNHPGRFYRLYWP
jgi:autotransporter-associated beta strand protein